MSLGLFSDLDYKAPLLLSHLQYLASNKMMRLNIRKQESLVEREREGDGLIWGEEVWWLGYNG